VSEDADEVRKDFDDAVNMTRSELEKWLDTDESRSVGATREGSDEAVGHESGRRIVAILGKKKAELTDADLDHMRTVVGYVHRHLAQKPEKEELETSRWRYSLMNWGHDPLEG
jgi:hypothetical protein